MLPEAEMNQTKEQTSFAVEEILIQYREKPFYDFIKRSFDLLASLIAIVALSWLFLLIAIAVRLDSKGPAFYKSTRYGKNGKPFTFYKYRSMVMDADKQHAAMAEMDSGKSDGVRLKVHNDPRITRVGKFLRKTSLDELPQLFNVLNGTMTLVGPRPCIRSEIELYDTYDKQRLLVKQGLTCIWQCSGRSNISFKEQVAMDIEYIEKRGILTDIKLLFKTIPAVLGGKGAE